MSFEQGQVNLVELTLPADTPLVGQRIGGVRWPSDTSLVAILRDGRVLVPSGDDALEGGDELLFVASPDVENEIESLLAGGS
jgi:trk system potassium uptake protein TrkA